MVCVQRIKVFNYSYCNSIPYMAHSFKYKDCAAGEPMLSKDWEHINPHGRLDCISRFLL